jgi:hypothetical protein
LPFSSSSSFRLFTVSIAFAVVDPPRFRFAFASFFARFLLRSSSSNDDVDASSVESNSDTSSIAEDLDGVSIDSPLGLLPYLMAMSIFTPFLLSLTRRTAIL